MTRRRSLTLGLGIIALCGLAWWRLSPSGSPRPSRDMPTEQGSPAETATRLVTLAGQTMGTTFSVKYVPVDGTSTEVIEARVTSALEAVNSNMSTYVVDSEVSRFNSLDAESPLTISEELSHVLEVAERVFEQTEGAFDVTVRPLVRAYGFGAGAEASPPDPATLEKLRKRVGMKLLSFDRATKSLSKSTEGVELDLGGIAKGFGVDQVTEELERAGIRSYMVEVGGEVRVKGKKPDAKSWRIAIEEPRALGRSVWGVLELSPAGASLATSGDYRNFRTIDDKVVSHTFDPRTGSPTPRRIASVSVVRPRATEADALATGLSVLEPEHAVQLANENDWAVFILVHREEGGFASLRSRAFEQLRFSEQLHSPH